MKKNRFILLLGVFLSILFPSVFAADETVIDSIGSIFKLVFDMLGHEYILFGLGLILLFMVLFGIIKAALAKVPVFKGGSPTLNVTAVGLSLLADIGIMYSLFATGMIGGIAGIFSSFGMFGAIITGLALFGIFYFLLGHKKEGSWQKGFIAAGIGMILAGKFIESQLINSLGWIFVVIGVIGMVSSHFGLGSSKDGRNGSSEERAARNAYRDGDYDDEDERSGSGRGKGKTIRIYNIPAGPNHVFVRKKS